jgi:co-chaperonin GroES (HSP10)
MLIKPFGSNILIKPTEQKQILVNLVKSMEEYGIVLAIGDEVKKIKVGDNIVYSIWGMKSPTIENEKYYIIPEDDRFILGTF